MPLNKRPYRAVSSRYEVMVQDGEKVTMLVLVCGHRRAGKKGQVRARCERCK